jgi:hypothetical protein
MYAPSQRLAVCPRPHRKPAQLLPSSPDSSRAWMSRPSMDVAIEPVGTFKELEASCDPFRNSGNILYPLRLDGRIKRVCAGAVNPLKTGTGLVDAAKAQSEFTFTNLNRTLVGLRWPGFSSAFQRPRLSFSSFVRRLPAWRPVPRRRNPYAAAWRRGCNRFSFRPSGIGSIPQRRSQQGHDSAIGVRRSGALEFAKCSQPYTPPTGQATSLKRALNAWCARS